MTPIDVSIIVTWVSYLVLILFYVSYFVLLYYFNKKAILTKKSEHSYPLLDYLNQKAFPNSKVEYPLIDYLNQKEISNQVPASAYPTLSLIVPVYNEEKTIARKIQNIEELDYPSDKIEVIFIDGHSTDKTQEIIAETSKRTKKPIVLIRQEVRNGYTKAVTLGILNAKGEIIVATDGGSFYYPDTILQLIKHFADEKIGAVTGKEVVLGKDGELGPQLEKSYRNFYDFMRRAETEIDSTPDSKGEILAVRKEICTALISRLNLSPNASFDSCVPYQAKLMGYRTIYDEAAKYYEHAPSSFSDRMKQQTRRATLLIGALLLYKDLLLRKKTGKFGTLILPIHFIMNCLLPTVFVIGTISLIITSFFDPLAVVIFWIAGLLLLVVSGKTRSLFISFIQSQFALLGGLFKLARRKNNLIIETIPSTRASA